MKASKGSRPARTADRSDATRTDDLLENSGAGAGFEAVLAASAFHGIGGLLPGGALRQLVAAVLRDPGPPSRRVTQFARDLFAIGRGSGKRDVLDRRFADQAWTENALLKRIALAYFASCDTLQGILDDAELEWRDKERLRLVVDNLLAALSPTNNPLTNPASWKAFASTRGQSLRSGLRNLATDLRSPTRLPSSVDKSAFTLGKNVAATPGKVVRRERLYELIEYTPLTERVDSIPALLVASPVNKFYLLDLDPKSSVIRAQLERGRRVFAVSWVNPDGSHADLGFDAYVQSIVEILETTVRISGAESAHLLGLCGGGQLVVMVAAYLAAIGRQNLMATLTVGIAIIDFERGPSAMAFLDRRLADRAIDAAAKKGYFDARDAARSFALMRPNDAIWSAVVNNYLLGKSPPAMALLYWAADQTNLAMGFGRDMIEATLDNSLGRPGGVSILGVPLDLRQITVDTYVLGASDDHISPWHDCYRTLAMLGGTASFVLARGGHATAIATPPGSSRASYRTGDVAGTDPEEWLTRSAENKGSWWDHWNGWIEQRYPDLRPAPKRLGSSEWPMLCDAPGDYVRRVIT